MNLVDSCGWLEYFAGGKNAGFFAAAIEDTERLLVPTICLLEVFKRVLQQRGHDLALQVVAAMQQGRVVELDGTIALSAARLGVKLGLPLADSVILATARAYGAVVWTEDSHFEGIDGVRYQPAS
ncbi:MAG: type II toxin-antitoxin system VapC family toxin [Deltaproteobacteria bacterium]|nr:MAG: type II toxin-antitoxin system VapC family toxin [Deltaproteobacteria bacterium]